MLVPPLGCPDRIANWTEPLHPEVSWAGDFCLTSLGEAFFFFFQRFNSDIIKRFRPFMPLLEGICCIYCNSFGQVGWYIAFLCFLKSVRVSLLYLLKAGWLSSVGKASPGETGEEHHIHSLPFSSVHLIQTSVPESGVSSLNHSKSSPSFILVCVPIISTHISIP